MVDVFLERDWDQPLTFENLQGIFAEGDGCFGRHRVEWVESLLLSNHKTLLCHFRSPDAESVRIGLRQIKVNTGRLWTGTEHCAPGLEDSRSANVMVTRRFEEPVQLEDIQAIEDAGAGCLQAHRVEFERTFFAADRRFMVCLYRAPDAESVRIAQRDALMPIEAVWSFERFTR